MEILSPDTGFNISAKPPEDSANAMLECFLENWRKRWFIYMKSTYQKDRDREWTTGSKMQKIDLLEGMSYAFPEDQLADKFLSEIWEIPTKQ